MQCPLCPTALHTGVDRIVCCGRSHRFHLEMDDRGMRYLILAIQPVEKTDAQVGDSYPVLDNSETFD